MGIISKSPTLMPPKQTSAKTHMAAGSGSRPVASKSKIMTSAPEQPHKLGRATKNAMK